MKKYFYYIIKAFWNQKSSKSYPNQSFDML